MRTMYIILSWVGWGWLVLVSPVIVLAVRRQRRSDRAGDRGLQWADAPATPAAAEVQSRP